MAKTETSPFRRPWEPLLVRLLPEQRKRLETAAEYKGKNLTAFIRDAAMRVVEEVEEDVRVAERHASEMKERKRGGLGNSLAIPDWAKSDARKNSDPAPSATLSSPTVVVNAASPSDGGSLIAWVVSAPHTVARAERERAARKIIEESTTDASERSRLLRAFEDDLASRAGGPSAANRVLAWLSGRR